MDAEHPATTTREQTEQKVLNFLTAPLKIKFLYDPPTAARLGLFPEAAGDSTGKLLRSFSLGKLQEALGLAETSESVVLETLDKLASERKIFMFSMRVSPSDFRDLQISCLVGCALHGYRFPTTIAGSHILKTILYKNSPHDLLNGIVKPSQRAADLRKEVSKDFEKRFPVIDAALQSAIRSQDRFERQKFEMAVLDALRDKSKI
jgi:hypothetical protein